MYTIRKKFRIEYAHQLERAYSKCCSEQIHGHSGIIELFFSNLVLDFTGMVIDFGEVKKLIGKYIDSWDHMLIMPNSFPKQYLNMLKKFNKNLKIVYYNPTAENMAKEIYDNVNHILKESGWSTNSLIRLTKVRFHETETGYAEYSPHG